MQQDILINWSPQETRVAVVEHGALQEMHIERPLQRGIVGNIYLGKVMRVLPGMQSAFIDIGLERSAFLHVADIAQRPHNGDEKDPSSAVPPAKPIEQLVFEGQTLMVQVIKDPLGSKGARLSAQVSIAGRLMVLLPHDENYIGISQKIPLPQRDALRERVMQLMQGINAEKNCNNQPTRPCGYIVRTNAEDASDTELLQDMHYLRTMWARIRQASQSQPAPSLLHQDLSLIQRVLRDMACENTHTIRIDSQEQHTALLAFAQSFMPGTVPKIQHYHGERPIFDLFAIDEEMAHALGRRVNLKSGGYLIIDQTEALTTIDINTGGFVGARNFDETIFKTNLEAAQAIARQLRLRNLGGIIIIDFIDMTQPEHQQAVLAELRKQLQRDRIKTMLGDFSQLGLLELTRKRTRESLARLLCEPCPACAGRGMVKTARSVVYDILREILREARQFCPREFRVIAAPQVIELLQDEESQHLAGLSAFIGKPIALRADSSLAQEQYDIVLF
ncbi:MAG: ribonuclease G [Brachymonas sp.]|jgi:ribonuclease G|nr:ribonuclease G [Brachymonas sp.]MBP6967058.1 ribonuclease G [Brachymonas sp.]MBP7246456.1 ribonuclease G [Brachymonas sp.]MBP7734224.1 ribonuclease G [Brachymonas sp.]MBP7744143.1 ribonuclease G [Brachymonas sp.]